MPDRRFEAQVRHRPGVAVLDLLPDGVDHAPVEPARAGLDLGPRDVDADQSSSQLADLWLERVGRGEQPVRDAANDAETDVASTGSSRGVWVR